MREALFGQVIPHEPKKFIASLAPEFELVDEHLMMSEFSLDNTMLKHLIAMTPYAYKAKADKRAELERFDTLDVRGEFCVYVFKKC